MRLPIVYREFYDVPRAFLVRDPERSWLLFDGGFDDEADEYPDSYEVYALAPEVAEAAGRPGASWDGLRNRATRRLGSVPVDAVRFDPTRRAWVEAESLRVPAKAAG